MSNRIKKPCLFTSPGFYIVSTPIGNIADITYRAVEILKQVDFIACEDTRVTARLLEHYAIYKKLIKYNDFSDTSDRNKIIDLIKSDKTIALVSDAGTPLISDPGYKLVNDIKKSDIPVYVVPGCCSVIAALSISGFATDRFVFAGFVPNNIVKRKNFLLRIYDYQETIIVFETARRLLVTLNEYQTILGNRKLAICRELTKTFEEVKQGEIGQIIEHYTQQPPKGELVLVIESKEKTLPDLKAVEALLKPLLQYIPVKTAVNIISSQHNIAKNYVYKVAINMLS